MRADWPLSWRVIARRWIPRVLCWMLLAIPVRGARAVIEVGAPVPDFTLESLEGQPYTLDRTTTTPALLLFVKPDEKYTSATLAALHHMIERQSDLTRGMHHWVIISRRAPGTPLDELSKILDAHPRWTALLDPTDALYFACQIVATPTLVVVGSDRTVAATHPGYDTGMEQRVRLALAQVRGIELPETATAPAQAPNLELSMARRLAGRGLYDRALNFYLRVADGATSVSAGLALEVADTYLALRQADPAETWLEQIPPDAPEAAQLPAFRERIQAVRGGLPDPAHQPQVRLLDDVPSTAGQAQGP